MPLLLGCIDIPGCQVHVATIKMNHENKPVDIRVGGYAVELIEAIEEAFGWTGKKCTGQHSR